MRFDPDRIWWPGWRIACAGYAIAFAVAAHQLCAPWWTMGSVFWVGFILTSATRIALKSHAELNEEDE